MKLPNAFPGVCVRFGPCLLQRISAKCILTVSQPLSSCVTVRNDQHAVRRFSFPSRSTTVSNKAAHNPICILNRSMAGHSKWHNIRHIKGAKDAMRARLIVSYVSKIHAIVKVSGESNPKYNVALAHILEQARAHSIPMASLETALKSAAASKAAATQGFIDGRGPGGFLFILETFTDKQTKIRNDVTAILKRNGGAMGTGGTFRHCFDNKGVIVTDDVDMDTALEDAIEVGAEEVSKEMDIEEKSVLQFLCDPSDFGTVRKGLEEKSYNIISAALEYVPTVLKSITEQELVAALNLITKLEALPETHKLYDNIQITDQDTTGVDLKTH